MPHLKHDAHFAKAAGSVSAAVSLSRITGLVREMMMARLFGAGAAYDAFLLGFRIPNLTRDLFAEGALSSAFVPTFSQYLARKDKAGAAELSNVVATAILLITGALCIAGMIFSPLIVRALAPGFTQTPGKFELAVLLTRIMFPFLTLVALAAQAMGALNALGRFGMPALASTCFNVGSVAIGLGAGFTVGRAFGNGLIVCMAFGVVGGGAAQLLWQLPALRREGFGFRPRICLRHPGLRQIGLLMVPAVIGNAALQINILVNTNLASGITDAAGHVIDGPVSWLGYAFRFLQLPIGLFGVAIASATLPAVSHAAAVGRMDDFRGALVRSLDLILLLSIPSSVGLAVMGEDMIAAVYQWGRFSAYDTHQTYVALCGYSVGLAGYAATKVLAPAFYALNHARLPMLVSLASIAVNLGAALALTRWAGMGHAGLALSTSIVALTGAVALLALLSGKVGGLGGGRLLRNGGKIVAAACIMGLVCRASSLSVHALAGTGKAAQLADVAISIPLGALVFFGAAHLFGVASLKMLSRRGFPDFKVS